MTTKSSWSCIIRKAVIGAALSGREEQLGFLTLERRYSEALIRSATVQLGSGDLIVLFTYGVSEAMNMEEEEWGEEKLLAALQLSGRRDPEGLVEAVFQAADTFAGAAPQHDDMTIVILNVGEQ